MGGVHRVVAVSGDTMTWPPEWVRVLRSRWEAGDTASEIASRLSAMSQSPVTRNAVLGKVYRMRADGDLPPVRSGNRSEGEPIPVSISPSGIRINQAIATPGNWRAVPVNTWVEVKSDDTTVCVVTSNDRTIEDARSIVMGKLLLEAIVEGDEGVMAAFGVKSL